MTKRVGAIIGIVIGAITLLGLLAGGVKKLDDVEDGIAANTVSIDTLLNRTRRTDSLVTLGDRWRKRQICQENGYSVRNCPLLRAEMGTEELEPNRAMIPEIP